MSRLVSGFGDERIFYCVSQRHHGHFGAGVRQEVLTERVTTEYVMFLDDDNTLHPQYLQRMIEALDRAEDGEQFAICAIWYLPSRANPSRPFVPFVLKGDPSVDHIDTLQVVVKTKAMRDVGWCLRGYCSDGFTYEELARRYKYVRVNECLAVHL